MNIKDGDSVVGKSKIKSLEKKNLIKKNEIDNELSNLWNRRHKWFEKKISI